MTVLIAGGGIAGLVMGLTLHQLGLPLRIYERVAASQPLGVGINLQPNSVRELFDLGLAAELEAIGIRTRQYGFYSKSGREIWVEPRGLAAGYRWPQFSIHRGQFQMLLLRVLRARPGEDCVVTGARVVAFETSDSGAALVLADGQRIAGDVVIAADGIHSAIRKQMVPQEGDPIWNGAIMWRGTFWAAIPWHWRGMTINASSPIQSRQPIRARVLLKSTGSLNYGSTPRGNCSKATGTARLTKRISCLPSKTGALTG